MLKRAVALTALALAAVAPAAPLAAQDVNPSVVREFPATISGSASSEVKFVPDRATVRISVQTRATSAAAAASENSRKQNAVLGALRSLGMSNEQLSTADYSVSPEYRYQPNNEPPTLIGYTVTNSIVADVRDVAQIGKVLDAALSNGANMISSLEFYSSNTDAARRQAVASAVAKARAEADVAARAAGGSLGTLMQLNISGGASYPPPPRPMAVNMLAKSAEAATPINPGEQTLTVNISASWHFVAGK